MTMKRRKQHFQKFLKEAWLAYYQADDQRFKVENNIQACPSFALLYYAPHSVMGNLWFVRPIG